MMFAPLSSDRVHLSHIDYDPTFEDSILGFVLSTGFRIGVWIRNNIDSFLCDTINHPRLDFNGGLFNRCGS